MLGVQSCESSKKSQSINVRLWSTFMLCELCFIVFDCASLSQRFSYSFFREAFPESVEVFAQALHQVLADQHRVVIHQVELGNAFVVFARQYE